MYRDHHYRAVCLTVGARLIAPLEEPLFAYSKNTYWNNIFTHTCVHCYDGHCSLRGFATPVSGIGAFSLGISSVDLGADAFQLLLALYQMAILSQTVESEDSLAKKPVDLHFWPLYGDYSW